MKYGRQSWTFLIKCLYPRSFLGPSGYLRKGENCAISCCFACAEELSVTGDNVVLHLEIETSSALMEGKFSFEYSGMMILMAGP